MKKVTLIIFVLFLLTSIGYGQSAGLVLQTGLTASYSKTPNLTSANQAHYGWMAGADARILDGGLYFLLGAQYHQTQILSTGKPEFFTNDLEMMKFRLGMGFTIVQLSYKSFIRSKVLGSVNFILDGPDTNPYFPNSPQPANLNDSSLGLTTGIGLTLGSLDFDLDFEYGLLNVVFKQPKSTFDSFTFMVGFHF